MFNWSTQYLQDNEVFEDYAAFQSGWSLSKEEVDTFRDNPEEYLLNRFGGGWFKLNFYEGPTFIVCVNFKPKGEPKWQHLVTKKSDGPIPS